MITTQTLCILFTSSTDNADTFLYSPESPLMIRLAGIPCSFYKTLYDLQIFHKGTVADHLNPQNSTEYVSAKCQHVHWYQITNKATLKGGISFAVFICTLFRNSDLLVNSEHLQTLVETDVSRLQQVKTFTLYVTHHGTYKVYLHIFQTQTMHPEDNSFIGVD